jgi:excinuclease ABC subunit B
MGRFKLITHLTPKGDQPQAIEALVKGIREGRRYQTLLGATGTGKTFVMAHLIAQIQRPTLIISHNKTLAAQLYSELKSFFPENAVEYFVSYYDYYQPEAYIPQTDTYIEKDASINDRLDRLRLSATTSLQSRDDVIVVGSVSCIYNLGDPEEYRSLLLFFEVGQTIGRTELAHRLVGLLYERNDIELTRGRFRVRGDVVDIFPSYEETAVRLELEGDRIARISVIDPTTGHVLQRLDRLALYPAKHFITGRDRIERALVLIEHELTERVKELKSAGKWLEAQRLESRTRYDMEMLKEVGYCHGIENYSRALSGRAPGERPWCLLDYFPKEFLTILDESHVTIPQLRGMYEGDRARKQVLVDFGFRLPSCLDNRPLKFEEFEQLIHQTVFVSATPGPYELRVSQGNVVEQIIRPTGLVDPEIEVRPTAGQVDHLVHEIRQRALAGERTLVTTLTKRMAEDLAAYLKGVGLRVTYIHSDLDAFERVEILRNLRLGTFDCVIGVNLLREGLDLPEVSLVCVLDADKEGFLRSPTTLIQVAGRAARHLHGKVILYADQITDAMRQAIEETERRRKIQMEYNRRHGITPKSVEKAIREGIEVVGREEADEAVRQAVGLDEEAFDVEQVVAQLEEEMELAARNLQFERAAMLRDQIAQLRSKHWDIQRPDAQGPRSNLTRVSRGKRIRSHLRRDA